MWKFFFTCLTSPPDQLSTQELDWWIASNLLGLTSPLWQKFWCTFSDTEVLFVLFLRYWQWRWCTLKVLILSSTDGLHPIGPYRYRACPGKLQDMCDVCKSNRLAPSWINSGWEWLLIQICLLSVRLLRGFDIIYFLTLSFHIEFFHTETGWIRIIMVMVMIYLVGAAK